VADGLTRERTFLVGESAETVRCIPSRLGAALFGAAVMPERRRPASETLLN
jgi:hypothetical protein